MELNEALEKYQQAIAAAPELSPKTGGAFSGRVFLVWDENSKGWDAEEFNVAERFFRWAFGAFERSHTKTIVQHLEESEDDLTKLSEAQVQQLQTILQPKNKELQQKVSNLFQAVHPSSSQASSPQVERVRSSPEMEEIQRHLDFVYGWATLVIDSDNLEASIRQSQQIRDRITHIRSKLWDPIDATLVEKLKSLTTESKDQLIQELNTLGEEYFGLADDFNKEDAQHAASDHLMQLSKQVKDTETSAALEVLAKCAQSTRSKPTIEKMMALENNGELAEAWREIFDQLSSEGFNKRFLEENIEVGKSVKEEAKAHPLLKELKAFAAKFPETGRIHPRIYFLETYIERSKPSYELLDRIATIIRYFGDKVEEIPEKNICWSLEELIFEAINEMDRNRRSLFEALQMIDAEKTS